MLQDCQKNDKVNQTLTVRIHQESQEDCAEVCYSLVLYFT